MCWPQWVVGTLTSWRPPTSVNTTLSTPADCMWVTIRTQRWKIFQVFKEDRKLVYYLELGLAGNNDLQSPSSLSPPNPSPSHARPSSWEIPPVIRVGKPLDLQANFLTWILVLSCTGWTDHKYFLNCKWEQCSPYLFHEDLGRTLGYHLCKSPLFIYLF